MVCSSAGGESVPEAARGVSTCRLAGTATATGQDHGQSQTRLDMGSCVVGQFGIRNKLWVGMKDVLAIGFTDSNPHR